MWEFTAMRRLEGKTAIVTGSATGIGEATARRLACEGAQVVVADINLAAGERVANEIRAAGGQAVARYFDLHDEASIAGLVESALATFGKLDVLHNNAADTRRDILGRDAAIAAMDHVVWDATFHGNARGTMLVIKHALPALLKGGNAAIINTSSGAALFGDLFRPAYGASKAAINSLTRYVAAQYGKFGVRCNAVSPGLIVTATSVASNTEAELDFFRRHTLTRELGQPDDFAAMVALLASDDGRFITGQVIAVDGGVGAHFAHFADVYPHFSSQWGLSQNAIS
jgi:NAD(P)-dependent dehydrogenase (short-subunit alcohol dehydrogenase family)